MSRHRGQVLCAELGFMLSVDRELATVAATGTDEEGLAALKAEGQRIVAAHEAALGRVNAGKTS